MVEDKLAEDEVVVVVKMTSEGEAAAEGKVKGEDETRLSEKRTIKRLLKVKLTCVVLNHVFQENLHQGMTAR